MKRPLETGSVSEQNGSDPSDPGIADSKSDGDLDQASNRKKSRHDNDKLTRLLQRLFPTQKKEVSLPRILLSVYIRVQIFRVLSQLLCGIVYAKNRTISLLDLSVILIYSYPFISYIL